MEPLDHPLPVGMRDWLPEEAAARRDLAGRLLRHVGLFGYSLVELPAFEYVSTFERGLGTLDPGEIVRFVEPETGGIVALRPDITPQVARLSATRLAARPFPHRLAYHATVVRRLRGSRARTQRQIAQFGVELLGGSQLPDLEVLSLSLGCLSTIGLHEPTLEISHAAIGRMALEPFPVNAREEILALLGQKDAAGLAAHPAMGLVGSSAADTVISLCTAHGDIGRLAEGPFGSSPQVQEVFALLSHLEKELAAVGQKPPRILFDWGEARGFDYYTGPFFSFYAEGPGRPLGGGGRYDQLVGRFGTPATACGFAFDLDALAWSLERQQPFQATANQPPRILVLDDAPVATQVRDHLRANSVTAVLIEPDGAESYARAWGYSHIVRVLPTEGSSALDLVSVKVAGSRSETRDTRIVSEGVSARRAGWSVPLEGLLASLATERL